MITVYVSLLSEVCVIVLLGFSLRWTTQLARWNCRAVRLYCRIVAEHLVVDKSIRESLVDEIWIPDENDVRLVLWIVICAVTCDCFARWWVVLLCLQP